MILAVIKQTVPKFRPAPRALALLLLCAALPALASDKKPQLVKPIAGPRATALRVTWLYVTPAADSQKVDRVQPGRELVVADHSGSWIRVYANTDIEQMRDQRDAPIIGDDQTPPPISGWMQAKGVVIESNPNGDQILMGAAATEESLASDPRGPLNAAKVARLLYRRAAEMFPNSPLAGEAAWRSADIQWQLQKSDFSTLHSAKEKDAYMRQQMDEDEMKKVIKMFPGTRWADLAAFELIDNKLCGDWQGQTQCPEKESDIYEKFAQEHPDGPRTAVALYQAIYRQAVLNDLYTADGNEGKAGKAKNHARELYGRLKDKFAGSDYSWRAGALVYKLDEGIPVYGIDQQ
jgi:hypothetical protein